jgi:hypothetical protein
MQLEGKKNKIQGFNPASWTRSSEPGQLDQILLIKVETHTLSNDFMRNLL